MKTIQRTIVNQVEITESGHIQVRLRFTFEDDVTGQIIGERNEGYHRFTLPPGEDTAPIFKTVNKHLQAMGWPAINDADLRQIQQFVSIAHTPQAIIKYRAARESAQLALNTISRLNLEIPAIT